MEPVEDEDEVIDEDGAEEDGTNEDEELSEPTIPLTGDDDGQELPETTGGNATAGSTLAKTGATDAGLFVGATPMIRPMSEHQATWPEVVQLSAAGVGLVLAIPSTEMPTVLHWGADPGPLDPSALGALALPAVPEIATNASGLILTVPVVPEGQSRWTGTPGLEGHRTGQDWSPKFLPSKVDVEQGPGGVGGLVSVVGVDPQVALQLTVTLELLPSGVLRGRLELKNTGEENYTVNSLNLALPVPQRADELIDFAGRWGKERTVQTHAFTVGTHLREGRHGRTGADAATLLMAATPGIDFDSGEAWGMHVAFSGNHKVLAERVLSGQRLLMGGELLLPGEVELAPGESYETPKVYGVYGQGFDGVAARLHEYLRARPGHPTSPRPVVMNVWEAVYFNQNLEKILELADLASEAGVERFVLDDGWFGRRRNDTLGLGDWELAEEIWGDGRFKELVDGVHGRGMQFGLWFEPEMVSVNSNLGEEHPDWILQVPGRLPKEQRFQQVLDLANPEAYEHVFGQIAAMVREYGIDYLKWDHNRDLVDAGSTTTGKAGVHEQTLAVYKMLDQLREEFPDLEIESCSSGGARVDLEILDRTDRVWASDCIDALDRQQIQRWTAQLLPPELVGSHVGAPRAHTTGRTADLEFRAATALFGHFGIEWDLSSASPEEREELGKWVDYYKQMRALIHGGKVVRRDFAGGKVWMIGAISPNQDEALYAFTEMERAEDWPTNRVQLPGLKPESTYLVTPSGPNAASSKTIMIPPSWWSTGITLTGRALAEIGLHLPAMFPEHTVLLHAREVG